MEFLAFCFFQQMFVIKCMCSGEKAFSQDSGSSVFSVLLGQCDRLCTDCALEARTSAAGSWGGDSGSQDAYAAKCNVLEALKFLKR